MKSKCGKSRMLEIFMRKLNDYKCILINIQIASYNFWSWKNIRIIDYYVYKKDKV